ncbi:MAG TPA: hypothetical protein VFK05_11370 [Polyangiaceae bacterium]|nr:hypothetical protein [Polyangiaceae bacterium]
MLGFGAVAPWLRGGVWFALGLGGLLGCHSADAPRPTSTARQQVDPSAPCGEDEVREYFCDDLLPLSSSRPAPEPYDNCPATTDIRHGSFTAIGRVAAFDQGFTDYTRKRVPPGHSCCYGWCAKVKIADPSQASAQACRDANGLRESFCMREMEGGTSLPAPNPFDRCPAALKPPEVVAFAVPNSALFDASRTAQRRREVQLADCCYGWCSITPAGTVLKSGQPKTK